MADMHPALAAKLKEITDAYVRELIGAVRATFSDFMGRGGRGAVPGAKAGRRRSGRRSPAETAALAKKVAAFVAGHPKGIRVEAMGKAMGLTTAELMVPIAKALESRAIKKTGQRRATTYFPGRK